MSTFILGVIVTIAIFVVGGVNFKRTVSSDGTYKSWSFNAKQALSILGIAIIVYSCVKTVPTGHTGVVTVFGKVEGTTLDAGVHFLAPWEEVIAMDNRIQKASVDMESTTSDMQTVDVKFTLNYQISKANASEIYKTIGTEYEDTVISAQITNTVKSVMAKYAATDLVTNRNGVSNAAEQELTTVLSKYNIEVVATAIEDLSFTDAFNASIENKVIAEQELEKAKTEQEKKNLEIEQEAKRKVTEAQGIADANKILSNSYSKEILQKMFLEKWDGKLPSVMGNAESMFDISDYIQ